MSIISVSGLFDMALNVVSHALDGLRNIMASIVGRVLSAFGLALVSFEFIVNELKAYLLTIVAGLPGTILNLISALGLDVAMTIILSALAISLSRRTFLVPKAHLAQIGVQAP